MRTARFWPAGTTLVTLVAVLLGACVSTSLVNQWKAPDYSGGPMRKALVVGVSNQPSVRRVFEDEFAGKQTAAGVEAIPSYTVLREARQADQALLESTVRKLGADGVLLTRLVKRQRETQVSAGYCGPAAPAGFYGWYSSAWMGNYEPQTDYQYAVVTLEPSLYSPQQSKLVWSGTTETSAPTDGAKDTARFAGIIIGALRKQRII